ncbi:MAG: M14 family zinc carboxypeptidase [Phycisphaerae bacterium]
MTAGWLSTEIPGGCARVEMDGQVPVLRPDAPDEISGNAWYAFMVGVAATDKPREIELRWPEVKPWSACDYNDNDSFAEVLDRAIFMDRSDGRWRRIEQVTRTDTGARITIPPGPADRRLAVGMPVTQQDLDETLSYARESKGARVEQIGLAPQGTPLHAIVLDASEDAAGTFVISAHQHFSEWAGIRMIDAMLHHLLDEPCPLLRRFRWIFYPCINADALAHGWRGDPHRTAGINLNRDWGPFQQPQTRAVRDHLLKELDNAPPLLHALDLHMGWHSRDTCGAGLTVFEEGNSPQSLIDQQADFTRWFYQRADYTDFVWNHGDVDRPNFAAWVWRAFNRPGQTLEVSRHRWRLRADGRWVPPSVDLQRRLGAAVAENLAGFYDPTAKEKR